MPIDPNQTNRAPASISVPVSSAGGLQIAQAMYNAVTEKTEKLSRSYLKDFVITRERFYQLHEKCKQACTQWTVTQTSTNVSIFRIDDSREVFSSFERASISDASGTAATESISYEFNILITPANPSTPKPQPYKVTVRAMSRIAAFEKMDRDGVPSSMFRVFGPQTLIIDVEYVDYSIARNLMSIVNSWVDEIEVPSKLEWAKYIQKHSHHIPKVVQILTFSVLSYSFYKLTPSVITSNADPVSNAGIQLAIRWVILVGSSLASLCLLAKFIGGFIENSIDNIFPISALKFNIGDDRLYSKYCARNRWILLKGAIAIGFVLFQNVLANFITDGVKAILN